MSTATSEITFTPSRWIGTYNERTHPEATEPLPKGLTLATKQHSTLTGSDLHITKVDATTGTELTSASQTTYDTRYGYRGVTYTVAPTGTAADYTRVASQ